LQSVNTTIKPAPFARAVPSVRLMPGMVDIASSTGRSNVRSTSSGVDPSYGRFTKISGGVTDGKASSGRRTAAMRPITNSDTKNMIVVTGRLMLNSAMVMRVLPACSRLAWIGERRLLAEDALGDGGAVSARAPAAFAVVRVRAPVQQVVHDRDHDQRQQRGHQQAADHGDRHRRAH